MTDEKNFDITPILSGLRSGAVVPFIGAGALAEVTESGTGTPMPADSDSLILAMNQGKPMAPKLMFEFSRAAMHVELKRGRAALTRFLDGTYRDRVWTPSPLYQWLGSQPFPYLIDTNRDLLLQQAWSERAHLLVVGMARLGGSDYRFKLYRHDGTGYEPVEQDRVAAGLPVLFKPLSSPWPSSSYVASDADFVDYLTELMGGFAIPGLIKRWRTGRQYLLIGMNFHRDTERMLLSNITFGAAEPAGWAFIRHPSDKERRFLKRQGFILVEAEWSDLLALS